MVDRVPLRRGRRGRMGNEETGDNFKPLLPICKTSTPGPRGGPPPPAVDNIVMPAKDGFFATMFCFLQKLFNLGGHRSSLDTRFFITSAETPNGLQIVGATLDKTASGSFSK